MEIYHPWVDHAAIRDLEFIVTGPEGFFSEEKRDCASDTRTVAPGIPAYCVENHCAKDRYRISKEIFVDPARDVLLQRISFAPLAVVTGASGGVGRATVRMLGDRGAKVVLLARGRDGLEGAKHDVESRGGRALVVPTDVSQFDQVQAAADAAEHEFGPIELWINNAMVSMYSPFMKMLPEEFKHIVEASSGRPRVSRAV